MEREILRQVWPIFSAEAREHLQAISGGILDLERDPGQAGVLDGIRRTAHSLKGSAGSLGLADVETLAHAIEGSLAGFDAGEGLSRAAVQAALDAVEAIEEAIASGDTGGESSIRPLGALLAALGSVPGAALPPSARAVVPDAAAPAARGAPRDGEDAPPPSPAIGGGIDALEGAVATLCAPLDAKSRRRVAEAAAREAAALAAAAPPHAAGLAQRAADAFVLLAVEGPEAARATAALAGDLIDLREALERKPDVESPSERVSSASGAPGAGGDKSIRVLASTLDSLSRQLELLAVAEARHARRAREVHAAEESLREVLRTLDAAGQALRGAGIDVARPELGAATGRVRALASDLSRLARDGQRDAEAQRLAGTVLREDLRALRMVPAALVLEPLRRAVRDVAGRLGKEVELSIEGGDVRIDRRVVDELRDPLVHLVRNAVDHGIEPPDARRAAGKSPVGLLSVRVETRGSRVAVVVEDDGPGLDLEAIRAAAVKKGVLPADAAATLPDADAARLVFHPGLSTARALTAFSGRGVGLDVVQETLQRLQGTVDVRFQPGRGTRFDLEVPLSLAATSALLFRVGRELAALPADTVERVLLLREGDIGTVGGRATVAVGKEQVPYAPMTRLLGAPSAEVVSTRRRVALVVVHGTSRVAVGVEEVLGGRELVVSSLGSRVAKVAHLAGASVLDDGRVVGLLAPAEIVRRAQPAAGAPRASAAKTRVLVADDSLTTRSAMKAVLEIAGYSVIAAADGEEALSLLRETGAQLVVSDVQMPRLDGLGLTRRVKSDPRLRGTPVILVTSLDAPEDRAAGLEAGADGYLVKREVERGKLLELVRQLLPDRP
jgi:two-component system chemotaxis sensor kinase CheA